jgi:predicted Zn-dependent protease
MAKNTSTLKLVRIGSDITYSSLKKIGEGILASFRGAINAIKLSHHNSPVVDSIDAQLLTMVLEEEYGGHVLGITDADLRTEDDDTFYHSILGGKNPKNDVAVVSTKMLAPRSISNNKEYDLFLDRTLKVALHEVGHNLGLIDHAVYKLAPDGSLCPMSRGEFNKFGYRGYVKAVVDGRGLTFCRECGDFLSKIYGFRPSLRRLLKDGLVLSPN